MYQFLSGPGFKKYLKNTSWLLGERVFRMGVSLFVGIYIARYLGPENYGSLNFALSFVLLFGALASFGLDDILVRELVKNPEQRNSLLGTIFWLKILGTTTMGFLIFIVLHFFSVDRSTSWMIAIISFGFLFQSMNVIDFFFQAKVKTKYAVRAQVLQLITGSFFKIFLVWSNAELFWFAFALMLDQALVAIFYFILYRLKIERFPFFSFNIQKAKKLSINSWPLIFAGMVVSVYMKIDQVMLKEMLGVKAVGIYAASVKLCEAWYFIPVAVMASLFPAVIEARKKNESLYKERVQKLFDLMVWGPVLIAIPTSLLSDWIIITLYGEKFKEAAEILRIYIWAVIFVSLGVASSKLLIAENLQKYSFFITSLGAAINILCNLLIIPIYGIKGAAIASIISFSTVGYLSLCLFSKTRNIFFTATNSLNFFQVFKRILSQKEIKKN